MGQLLSLRRASDISPASEFSLVIGAKPLDSELEEFNAVQELMSSADSIIESIRSYKGCGEAIRAAISSPSNENLEAVWNELCPHVKKLVEYYNFSCNSIEKSIPLLLRKLCPGDPLANVEQNQALTRQFADILHFVFTFDDLKMANANIQNDFSFYRRSLSRMKASNTLQETHLIVSDDVANKISLFYAYPTPMFHALIETTTNFINQNTSTITIEKVTSTFATLTSVCLSTAYERSSIRGPDALMLFLLNSTVSSLILYDYIDPLGAFHRNSPINVKNVVKLIEEKGGNRKENLMNALKFNTKHLNDDVTPKLVKLIRTLQVSSPSLDSVLEPAVNLLKKGEILAFPTETVYGLGANAFQKDAVAKIYSAKQRPCDNPLIVHISDLKMLKNVIDENSNIPECVTKLIDVFWPGPLTILFKKNTNIPNEVTCGLDYVGVRMPNHPVALKLISLCGFPLAAPSANKSGRPSPTSADHVMEDFNDALPAIVDGGNCEIGLESTVLDLFRSPPAILRPGGVTFESLLKYLPDLQMHQKHFQDKELEARPTTPGMKYKHYSPTANVILFESFDGNVSAMKKLALEYAEEGKTVGILRMGNEVFFGDNKLIIEKSLGDTAATAACSLFKGLRGLDKENVDIIIAQGITEDNEGSAVMNRLRKAASHIISNKPKAAAAKPAKPSSGGGKQKKKKWSKGKVKDKVNHVVYFDKVSYDKFTKEVPQCNVISTNVIVEKFKVNASVARRAIKELLSKGLIKVVSESSADNRIYTRATAPVVEEVVAGGEASKK